MTAFGRKYPNRYIEKRGPNDLDLGVVIRKARLRQLCCQKGSSMRSFLNLKTRNSASAQFLISGLESYHGIKNHTTTHQVQPPSSSKQSPKCSSSPTASLISLVPLCCRPALSPAYKYVFSFFQRPLDHGSTNSRLTLQAFIYSANYSNGSDARLLPIVFSVSGSLLALLSRSP